MALKTTAGDARLERCPGCGQPIKPGSGAIWLASFLVDGKAGRSSRSVRGDVHDNPDCIARAAKFNRKELVPGVLDLLGEEVSDA
jgi:hypothetical protein